MALSSRRKKDVLFPSEMQALSKNDNETSQQTLEDEFEQIGNPIDDVQSLDTSIAYSESPFELVRDPKDDVRSNVTTIPYSNSSFAAVPHPADEVQSISTLDGLPDVPAFEMSEINPALRKQHLANARRRVKAWPMMKQPSTRYQRGRFKRSQRPLSAIREPFQLQNQDVLYWKNLGLVPDSPGGKFVIGMHVASEQFPRKLGIIVRRDNEKYFVAMEPTKKRQTRDANAETQATGENEDAIISEAAAIPENENQQSRKKRRRRRWQKGRPSKDTVQKLDSTSKDAPPQAKWEEVLVFDRHQLVAFVQDFPDYGSPGAFGNEFGKSSQKTRKKNRRRYKIPKANVSPF